MALGGVTNSVSSGSAPAGSASTQAKTVIALGVSTAGTAATLYSPSSKQGVSSALDVGPLAEYCALLLAHRAGQVFAVPLNQSTAGGLSSAVTQTGTGTGTVTPACAPHKTIVIKCTTGGTIGTAAFAFSLDGGTTYGSPVTSVGPAPFVYAVPGTFCSLSFAAATYVATKICTIGTDGTVTNGSAWVGVVTQTSSPVDSYETMVTIATGGALGTARVQISLDGGPSLPNGTGGGSTIPTMLTPAGGVVVIPGTGIYLTLSGTFTANDTYSFLAFPPSFSTSDVSTALTAAMKAQGSPQVALVHVVGLPASASGAFSLASTIQTSCNTAASSYGKQWNFVSECPCSVGGQFGTGDIVISGSNAINDTADTESTIRTARAGTTCNNGSVFVGTHRVRSYLTSYTGNLRRPAGWPMVARYVENDPNIDPSYVGIGALDVIMIGRDELTAGTSLHDAQLNVLQSRAGMIGAFLAIESGGFGWRNLNTDPNYQDANSVRMLAIGLAAITNQATMYLGARPATNSDGTIAESARQAISADLDATLKRALGLLVGGAFAKPIAASASASVLASSQVGSSPYRLDVQYSIQRLGYVSAVANNVFFSGTLPIQAAGAAQAAA